MKEAEDRAKYLGATHPAGTSQVVVFIPSRDREGIPVDQLFWREEALRVFGTLFRGATAFPPGEGIWRDDEGGGALQREQVIMVVSYTNSVGFTEAAWEVLRNFLHRLGKEANQGEVGIVIDSVYYGISRYDPL